MSMDATVHIFQYIGSKERMAGVLSRLIPKTCEVYAELYCGSAALALNSRKFDVKILNDLNPHVSNFWKVATNPETRPELLERLQQTRYSWGEFMAAKKNREERGSKRSDVIQWATETFVLNRQSFNATGDSWVYRDAGKYKKELTAITDLPLAFKALEGQSFRVYNTNAVSCLEQEHLLQNPNAFIFLDPPYLEGLRSDSKLYQVDMPDVRDHINLLKVIRDAKAKIVLSGYWSGKDDGTDLYDYYLLPYGWHRHLLGEYTKGCETGVEKSKGAEWVGTNYDLAKEAPGALAFLKSYCDDKGSPLIKKWLETYKTK